MTRRIWVRSLPYAIGISAVLNLIWMFAEGRADAQNDPHSWLAQIVDGFARPGSTAALWLIPEGHTTVLLVSSAIATIAFTFVFYGLLAWAALAMWFTFRVKRNRAGRPGE